MTEITLFFSYAQEDEPLLTALKRYLQPLIGQGFITDWYDHNIAAGLEWMQQRTNQLNTATIIAPLISSDYLYAEYTSSTEMHQAVQRHEAGTARIIPIFLRPVYWKGTPFGARIHLLHDPHDVVGGLLQCTNGPRSDLCGQQRRRLSERTPEGPFTSVHRSAPCSQQRRRFIARRPDFIRRDRSPPRTQALHVTSLRQPRPSHRGLLASWLHEAGNAGRGRAWWVSVPPDEIRSARDKSAPLLATRSAAGPEAWVRLLQAARSAFGTAPPGVSQAFCTHRLNALTLHSLPNVAPKSTQRRFLESSSRSTKQGGRLGNLWQQIVPLLHVKL